MNYAGFQTKHPVNAYALQRDNRQLPYPKAWPIFQRMIALLALAILSPVIAAMYLATKLGSKGPFLFTQQRSGLSGKVFNLYKVRTMKPGSEKATALGVVRSDPRVTSVGRILRATKLDELPQLWNIANGDMALVGPRPIPMNLETELRAKIPGFEQRYAVPPGLTSIGQICVKDNALGDALVKDWSLRFQGELHYIRNRSLAYDLLMIAMTSTFVIKSLTKKL